MNIFLHISILILACRFGVCKVSCFYIDFFTTKVLTLLWLIRIAKCKPVVEQPNWFLLTNKNKCFFFRHWIVDFEITEVTKKLNNRVCIHLLLRYAQLNDDLEFISWVSFYPHYHAIISHWLLYAFIYTFGFNVLIRYLEPSLLSNVIW